MTYYLVCAALPFIAALQRYAVAYGYEGVSKNEAWLSAKGTFIMMVIIAVVIAAIPPK